MLQYLKFMASFWKGLLLGDNSPPKIPSLHKKKAPVKPTAPKTEKPKIKLPAPLITFDDVVSRYGTPYNAETQKKDEDIKNKWEQKWMTLWKGSKFTKATGVAWPKDAPFSRIYCNKDLVPYINNTFITLIEKGLFKELKTFDGCWNVRPIRGSKTGKWSTHSFGVALDLNAKENPLNGPINFSPEFLQVWRDTGWTCGADFKRKDGMHFQIPQKC
jgi:hypothetical protein